MSDIIAELMTKSCTPQREYPSRQSMQEFVFDNVDMLTFEESAEILRFIIATQNDAGLTDVSEGVALNITKLELFVLQSVYDMIIRFRESAGTVESIVFD